MTHPKFNDESRCQNCAAFEDFDMPSEPRGLCHRHAPRPSQPTETYGLDDGNTPIESTQRVDSLEWPVIDNYSAMFCCEWLPKPAAKDKWPTWNELIARPEMGAKFTGSRARCTIEMWRDEAAAAATVEKLARWTKEGQHNHGFYLRNYGEACHRLVLAAIEGWRRDGGQKLEGAK